MQNINFREWFEAARWQTSCAMIYRDDKFLILKRGPTAPWMPGKWNLPGGGVDHGEKPEEAATRELKEEAGLFARSLKLFDRVSDPHLGDTYFYLGKADGEVKLDFENDQYSWITVKDLNKYNFVPYVKEVLQKAFNMI